ncbi:MAG: NTP transferase domain-containing protein [Myxococcota bacterium]
MRVAGLVAAAGASSRMGFPKALLAPRGGPPLLLSLARAFREGGAETVFTTLPPDDVVASPHRPTLMALRRALDDADVIALHNEDWESGLIGSVRTVLRRAPDVDVLVFTPVDAPACTPSLVRALIQEATRHTGHAAHPLHDARPGHPLLLPRALFAPVLAFTSEGGVRAALSGHPVRGVAWEDARVLASVDVPSAAEAWDPPLTCWQPG